MIMITSCLVSVNKDCEYYFVPLSLNLWDMWVDLYRAVKILIVTCHGLAANPRTLLPLKITGKRRDRACNTCMKVYGNKINKAFVKRIIYILKVIEIENLESVLWQLPLYHTFPEFLFVLVVPSLLVILCHHEILSHPLWRNQR